MAPVRPGVTLELRLEVRLELELGLLDVEETVPEAGTGATGATVTEGFALLLEAPAPDGLAVPEEPVPEGLAVPVLFLPGANVPLPALLKIPPWTVGPILDAVAFLDASW